MALTATDFADITARGLFIGRVAVATAQSKSTLLASGAVADAAVSGAFANEAHSVSFPVFTSNLVAADMPADGTAVADSYTQTETFVTENVATKLVPYRYMPNAIRRGVNGEAGHWARTGQQIGYVMADSIESQLFTKAYAAATANSMVYTTGASAKVDLGVITGAATSKWGAHWNPSETLIVVSPSVYNDLLNDTDVVKASTSSVTDLSGNPIPSIYGMGIIMNDKVAKDNDVYDNLLVRKGSLQVYMAQELNQFEETHIPGSGANQIDYTFAFATHVDSGYPCGVVVFQTK